MRYLKSSLYLMLFLFVLLNFSCASPRVIGNLPTDMQDFSLSEVEIKDKYPEILTYDINEWKGILGYCTSIQELETLWGTPDEQKSNWFRYHIPAIGAIAIGSAAGGGIVGATVGTGIVLGMVPAPFQTYTWHKGNYKIHATTDLSIFCGYKRRLIYWEWDSVSG